MTRELAADYDKILHSLDPTGALTSFNYDDDEEKESYFKAFRYFAANSLIATKENIGAEILFVHLTAEGIRFLHNGGFSSEVEKEAKEERFRQLEIAGIETAINDSKSSKRLAVIALIVSGLSLLAQIITTLVG